MERVCETLTERLERGVAEGVFPGGATELWRGGRRLARAAVGRTRADGVDERPVTVETVYDVASLTKVFTAVATHRLAARGELELAAPLADLLPVASGLDATVADLLRHTSGLPAWRPFYETERGRDAVVSAVAREPAEGPAGQRAVYSDLGFILLGAALEARTGLPLDAVVSAEVLQPLGLETTRFLPVGEGPVLELERRPVAATERCPWRGRVLAGEVHDDNCWAMGGIAGHAGLFSTAGEVARLGADLLACRRGEGVLLGADEARLLTEPSAAGRPLGLDVPSGPEPSAGSLFSRRSFGHLGFTGCSLWCDPDRDLAVALLTNRVHPTRDNLRIRAFRPAFHDSVVRVLERGG